MPGPEPYLSDNDGQVKTRIKIKTDHHRPADAGSDDPFSSFCFTGDPPAWFQTSPPGKMFSVRVRADSFQNVQNP